MKQAGYMDIVIAAARRAADAGEVPVAAAVVDVDGNIVAVAENRMQRDANATHHAEILALNAAMAAVGKSRLDGFDLWVSLEPCTMCAGAIAHARIRRLYFAATDIKGGAVESGVRFFNASTCHHKPDIYGGIQAAAAEQLLTAFFAGRRVP
jgi:tRNA(Arg) A34 adenosine deaminase TadA